MRNKYGLPFVADEYERAEQADRRTRALVFLSALLFLLGAVALLGSTIYTVH